MEFWSQLNLRRYRKSGYIAIGALIGVLAGSAVSLFRYMIGFVLEQVVHVYSFLREQPQWILAWILFSIVMGLILGQIVKSDPDIKGSGIPQVELQLQGKMDMNWWSVFWKKFVGGAISIGSGLLLGREGPSIQLGASVGQGVAETLKANRVQKNVFISSGAGAGLAAAFNAPIAGLMFVLEEVHHTFSPLVAVTTLTAAIVANFISLNIFGTHASLNLGNDQLFPINYYGYVVLLGIILAIFGLAYHRLTLSLPKIYKKLFPKVAPYNYCLIAFMLIIPLGMWNPHVLGGGGELILALIKENHTVQFLAGLFVIRFVFSMISYGTGLPGGIFLPILSLGALLGLAYAEFLIDFLGVDPSVRVSFVFFAMAGYFAAIGKAPLTALLLVTEMVGGLNQLMPLGICTLVAYIVADFLKIDPIYEVLAERLDKEHSTGTKGERTTFEVPIMVDSPLVEKEIRDIEWPQQMIIATVRRGAKEIIARGDTVLRSGDILIVVCDEGMVGKMNDEMTHLVTAP